MMGTRINVLLNHQLNDYRDRAEVLDCLSQALPEALAVRDYWNRVRISWERSDDLVQWKIESTRSTLTEYAYTGPGSLYVTVKERVAKIYTGGRWRGFLGIEEIRAIHLSAFRSICRSLGATRAMFYPDDEDLFDMFYDGRSLEDCHAYLEDRFGPPQPSTDDISPSIIAQTEHTIPVVWFMISLP